MIFDNIKSLIKNILPYIVICILCIIITRQCLSKSELKDQMQHNIEALSDSIHHYKTNAGNIAAEKKILIGGIDLLKQTNDSLYQRVKDLNVKNPEQVVYITNDVVHESHDTIWTINNTSLSKDFDFSNKYRELAGNVSLKDTTLGLYINKDIVHLDYTMAIKDGKVYVSSTNPYIKFNNIEGITIPKTKQKHWHIGPSIGIGINTDKKVMPYIGINAMYSLFSW